MTSLRYKTHTSLTNITVRSLKITLQHDKKQNQMAVKYKQRTKRSNNNNITSPVTAVTAIKSIFGDQSIKLITNDDCFSSVCRNDVVPGISVNLRTIIQIIYTSERGQRLTSGPYILVIQMAFLQPCSAYESISEIKFAGFALIFLHEQFKVVGEERRAIPKSDHFSVINNKKGTLHTLNTLKVCNSYAWRHTGYRNIHCISAKRP